MPHLISHGQRHYTRLLAVCLLQLVIFTLPAPWDDVVRLRGKFTGAVIAKESDGFFRHVVADIYEMERD